MANPDGGFSPLARPRFTLKRFLFYFVTIAVLLLIFAKISEFALIWEVFRRANLWWLIGIIVSQLINYYFLALNYRSVLKIKDLAVPVRELFPAMFVVQFLNQALPSATISGQAFFVQYLKRYGLPLAEAIGRAILELLTLYVAFGAFFLLSAILLFYNNNLAFNPQITYFIYLFVFFGALFTGIFFAFQRRRRGRATRWVIGKLHRYFEANRKPRSNHTSHVEILLAQARANLNFKHLGRHRNEFFIACVWQGLELLANVFTLYFVCYAVDAPLSLATAFIVFTLTRFVSMASFVPGAFGIFEGSMTFVLTSFFIPVDIALAITLLFRAFSFWLPIPIGWTLYRHYVKQWERVEIA